MLSGIEPLRRVRPVVGKPVRIMLAQRVRDRREVPSHIPGLVHVEHKYDGERVQTPIPRRGAISLYSWRQENITHQYPDVVEAIGKAFQGNETILEGEMVAIDPRGGKLEEFQVLMRRRRKHDVALYVEKVPVKSFLFDVL